MAESIALTNITHAFGVEPLFTGIDLSIQAGERLGLIGANGTGKSTLLRIIEGDLRPDAGTRICHGDQHVVCVAQQEAFPVEATIRSVLEAADGSGSTAARLFDELGCEDPDQALATLSGGWRKRVAIAAALASAPDVLLLDEPTNHLDLKAVLWLQDRLLRFRGTIVLVTHDRWFLDRVATRVVELGPQFPGGTFTARGSYGLFLEARDRFLEDQRAEQERLANRMRREDAWLARRPKARTTKSVARIKQAEALREDLKAVSQRNAADRAAQFDFQATHRQGNELVTAEGIVKRYDDQTIFEDFDGSLAPGECLGLTGLNGSGKSTLMQVLGGTLAPDGGTLKHAHALRVLTFMQDRSRLDLQKTLRRTLCPNGDTVDFAGRKQHVAGYARRFLFEPSQFEQPVGSLSGGEQARLLIALLMLEPADLLLLDEPTNDLDIPSLEVLEEALLDFPGAVVLITHDRFLLDRVCDRIVALDGRGGARHFASYGQWEDSLAHAASEPIAAEETEAGGAVKAGSGLSWNEQKELRGIEGRIAKAEEKVTAIEAKMADPAVYANPEKVARFSAELDEAQQAVERLYHRWEELEARA